MSFNPRQSWEADGPAVLLQYTLEEGLAPFSPSVRMFMPGEELPPLFELEPSIWNACCLELFNHIVEHTRPTRLAPMRLAEGFSSARRGEPSTGSIGQRGSSTAPLGAHARRPSGPTDDAGLTAPEGPRSQSSPPSLVV